MKAVVCTRYGPPSVLELQEVEKPVPKDQEVLIRVHARTGHRGDVGIRSFDVPRAATGGVTALRVLRRASIRSGQQVLIYGASGSVGTYAVQLAKSFGADVTGVCSSANREMVRSLGADRVIDYTRQDFTDRHETYDVVFDAVDKLSSSRAKRALKKDGVYLNVTKDSGSGGPSPQDLVCLTELIETGKVRTVIDRRYSPGGHRRGPYLMSRKGTSAATYSSPSRSGANEHPVAVVGQFDAESFQSPGLTRSCASPLNNRGSSNPWSTVPRAGCDGLGTYALDAAQFPFRSVSQLCELGEAVCRQLPKGDLSKRVELRLSGRQCGCLPTTDQVGTTGGITELADRVASVYEVD